MAINPFWQNPFGQNVAQAGVSGPTAGLMGEPPASGAGLFGKWQALNADPVKRDALMAFAGQLLAGGGYSPVKQSSSEIFGRALLASQQARAQAQDQIQKQRYIEAQIANLEEEKQSRSPFGTIDPDQFTPESLAEFQQSGNYGVLKPRGGLSGIGNFNPGDYTPDSFAKFLKSQNPGDLARYVAPAQPSVQVVNGVPTVVQPTRGGGPTAQDPLSSLASEANAAAALAGEKARATATGTASGEVTAETLKKGAQADAVIGIVELAEPLIDASTGSLGGVARDKLVAVFGFAPQGAQAAAQLQILQAGLMLNQPRMEGPQGVLDVKLYEQMAGQIGDPAVPGAQKKAALKTIRTLQEKYKERAANTSPTGYRLVPEGTTEAQAGKAANIQSLLDKYPPRK